MRMVSINRHIYFLYYFVVFAFPPAFGGDAASCLEVELAVFLLDEAYHDSAVQLSVGIMPHDAGVEAPAVVFGLGDDFYGFWVGGAGGGAVGRHCLRWNQCARFMEGAKIDQRHAEVKRLVDEFHADGVIYENMKFCEFWSYEKVLASHILTEEMGVPCCTIEKEYALGSIGQLRTRFQAFVESLEIKKINS